MHTQISKATEPAGRGLKSQRMGAPEGKDALGMLRTDHRRVAELFELVDQCEGEVERKLQVVQDICGELTVHARLEEEIFYPAVRAALGARGDGDLLLDKADIEHGTVKVLIAELSGLSPEDRRYDAVVKVLGEYVRHHVEEEERVLFPKVRRSGIDLTALGQRMAERKTALASDPDALSS